MHFRRYSTYCLCFSNSVMIVRRIDSKFCLSKYVYANFISTLMMKCMLLSLPVDILCELSVVIEGSNESSFLSSEYKQPKSFSWEKYLEETGTQAAPARAFKPVQYSSNTLMYTILYNIQNCSPDKVM